MNIDIEKLLDTADLMVATQSYDKAISIYEQIIEANSDCDEAYLMRGALYGELGQSDKAFKDVLKAISIDPEYDGAHLTLSFLYKSQGNIKLAIESCNRAMALNKTNNEASQHIIKLYEMLGDKQLSSHQVEQAAVNYQLALEHAPGNINLLYKLAFSTSKNGDFSRAKKIAEDILNNDEHHVPTQSLLVSIYEKTGETEKGWKLIEELIHKYPDNASINITYGKYALRNDHQIIAISRLKHVLQSEIANDDLLSVHMLLGKLYDSVADYENAFTHFDKANSYKYNDYDINIIKKDVSRIINCFTKAKYREISSSKNASRDMIFILGMPRSGTSLIEQIVSSHSNVYGGGELHNVAHIANDMKSESDPLIQYPEILNKVTDDDMDDYSDQLVEAMQSLSPESQKITDKLPHNFLYIGLIHKLLPNAKIINCLRNPVDTCLSCYFQHFGGSHPYAYNLSHLAEYYHQYDRLMHHWQYELKIPMHNVKYENIVNNTEDEVRNILNYLELDWEDSCIEFYKNKRVINTASYTQVTKKIYTKSMDRWLNYEPYISELIKTLNNKSRC